MRALTSGAKGRGLAAAVRQTAGRAVLAVMMAAVVFLAEQGLKRALRAGPRP